MDAGLEKNVGSENSVDGILMNVSLYKKNGKGVTTFTSFNEDS